jgi:hypothetical protein
VGPGPFQGRKKKNKNKKKKTKKTKKKKKKKKRGRNFCNLGQAPKGQTMVCSGTYGSDVEGLNANKLSTGAFIYLFYIYF